MSHSVLLSKDYFVHQLVYIDEHIKELTELYISSTPVGERVKDFFAQYTLEVEGFLKENQRNDLITSIPKVFIGSKVTVVFEDEDDTEEYIISYPEQTDPDSGIISFLSPVGRQLLLKRVGDQVSIKIPSGQLTVTIQEISFAGHELDIKGALKEA
ncbi:hypothetical protein A8F94_18745 [Bacillus sp. FJAT-27225]|uniref:GreA/GreB family elongation factor n=1 Tax=Bacillus sp. FJAT-27225 TaxID=1743144 RepID=UPI00080C2504|nr:GreA/GreB family elongation factor [Bacillus sp. FJAT-27225]OCA83163.1 hypothetical protein A8F94_18745 [Bacillus sp. FJAT-27225]